ncbi:MAG: hypothetical protein ACLVL7_02910 [Anaerotruncus massiliensis (ex Togo et al. 2019)]
MDKNTVYSINGPVVTVRGARQFEMQEMFFVGNSRLIGEVINISDEHDHQVYEGTTGMRPGSGHRHRRAALRHPRPGHPLEHLRRHRTPARRSQKRRARFIPEGSDMPPRRGKKWPVTLKVKEGDRLRAATSLPPARDVDHRAPLDGAARLDGTVVSVRPDGDYTVLEPLVVLRDARGTDHELALAHKWPIRQTRRWPSACRSNGRSSPGSGSSTPSSRSPRAAPPPSRAASAPARR